MYSIKDSAFNIYLLWLLYLQFVTSSFSFGTRGQCIKDHRVEKRCRIFWRTVSLFNLILFLYGEIKVWFISDILTLPLYFTFQIFKFLYCQNTWQCRAQSIKNKSENTGQWDVWSAGDILCLQSSWCFMIQKHLTLFCWVTKIIVKQ